MTMTFRGSEIILLWSKQAQRCLHLVVNRSKNCLFRVFSTPMYVCQLWNECSQSSIKRLRIAYVTMCIEFSITFPEM